MADFDPVSYMMGQKAGPSGGSTTLSGLTDVDISNPTDGQVLVYNATTGKWENGAGGGGDDIFETLGTITAATVPMTYDDENHMWVALISSDILIPVSGLCAARNMTLKIGGTEYLVEPFKTDMTPIGEMETTAVKLNLINETVSLVLASMESVEPVITDVSVEVYGPTPELEVLLMSTPK